jgi:hypothetical protein
MFCLRAHKQRGTYTLAQVYLSAIVQCISAFLNACYIARRNAITSPMLNQFEECVEQFHTLRNVFTTSGIRETISLPRQHALLHFRLLIPLFGAPNGLCSSITESRHVKAVKKTWQRSSRHKALRQMLQIISRLENMATARLKFTENELMVGSTSEYTLYTVSQTQLDDGVFESDSDEDISESSLDDSDASTSAAVLVSFPMDSNIEGHSGDSDCDMNTNNLLDSGSELSDDEDVCDVVAVDDVVQDESLFKLKVSDRAGEY